MKCLNDCGKEAVGRSKYCGKTCRALYSKRNRNKAQLSATEQLVKAGHSTGKDGMALAALGIQHPGNTAPTTQNTDEQEDAGRKKSKKVIASYPGCFDPTLKSGKQEMEDTVFGSVEPGELPEENECMFEAALKDLPPEPTRPTGRPNATTANMTAQQLRTRLSLYQGLDWINSPEHAETIYRLLTLTLDELKGQSIPAWRQSQEAA